MSNSLKDAHSKGNSVQSVFTVAFFHLLCGVLRTNTRRDVHGALSDKIVKAWFGNITRAGAGSICKKYIESKRLQDAKDAHKEETFTIYTEALIGFVSKMYGTLFQDMLTDIFSSCALHGKVYKMRLLPDIKKCSVEYAAESMVSSYLDSQDFFKIQKGQQSTVKGCAKIALRNLLMEFCKKAVVGYFFEKNPNYVTLFCKLTVANVGNAFARYYISPVIERNLKGESEYFDLKIASVACQMMCGIVAAVGSEHLVFEVAKLDEVVGKFLKLDGVGLQALIYGTFTSKLESNNTLPSGLFV